MKPRAHLTVVLVLAAMLAVGVAADQSAPDGRVFLSSRARAAASSGAVARALHPDVSVLATAPRTIPYFEDTFVYAGQTYRYAMAGRNPKTTQGTMRIRTVIVPLRFVFADGRVFDPSSTIANLRRSPLFRPAPFTSGVTQYGDAIHPARSCRTW